MTFLVRAGAKASLGRSEISEAPNEYVSDPAKPVRIARVIGGTSWSRWWLTINEARAPGRCRFYLRHWNAPVKYGEPIVNLIASTSGLMIGL